MAQGAMNPQAASEARWRKAVVDQYGDFLPDDYFCFDLETTGFSPTDDLVVEVGYTNVVEREAQETKSFLMDWTRYPGIDQDWQRTRLAKVAPYMEAKGVTRIITPELLRKEGKDPIKVLKHFWRALRMCREYGIPFVGHNALSFDSRRVKVSFEDFLGKEWDFYNGEIIDTGGIEKGMQAGRYPDPDEDLSTFLKKITHMFAKGVKWNIHGCVLKYDFKAKHGVVPENLHGAGEDSRVCHYLFEEYREMFGLA